MNEFTNINIIIRSILVTSGLGNKMLLYDVAKSLHLNSIFTEIFFSLLSFSRLSIGPIVLRRLSIVEKNCPALVESLDNSYILLLNGIKEN